MVQAQLALAQKAQTVQTPLFQLLLQLLVVAVAVLQALLLELLAALAAVVLEEAQGLEVQVHQVKVLLGVVALQMEHRMLEVAVEAAHQL